VVNSASCSTSEPRISRPLSKKPSPRKVYFMQVLKGGFSTAC
jgi:hypothetical protein